MLKGDVKLLEIDGHGAAVGSFPYARLLPDKRYLRSGLDRRRRETTVL
jgi:hypothetical protein